MSIYDNTSPTPTSNWSPSSDQDSLWNPVNSLTKPNQSLIKAQGTIKSRPGQWPKWQSSQHWLSSQHRLSSQPTIKSMSSLKLRLILKLTDSQVNVNSPVNADSKVNTKLLSHSIPNSTLTLKLTLTPKLMSTHNSALSPKSMPISKLMPTHQLTPTMKSIPRQKLTSTPMFNWLKLGSNLKSKKEVKVNMSP